MNRNRILTLGSYAMAVLLFSLFSPSTTLGHPVPTGDGASDGCADLTDKGVSLRVGGIGGGSARGTLQARPVETTTTVQAGAVAFDSAPGDGRFSVAIQASTIRFFNNTAGTTVRFDNPTTYTVTVLDPLPSAITGVSVAINGVTGFTASNVSSTANSVTFTVTGSVWHGGDSVIVQLIAPCTPVNTPTLSAGGLVLFGLLLGAVALLVMRK